MPEKERRKTNKHRISKSDEHMLLTCSSSKVIRLIQSCAVHVTHTNMTRGLLWNNSGSVRLDYPWLVKKRMTKSLTWCLIHNWYWFYLSWCKMFYFTFQLAPEKKRINLAIWKVSLLFVLVLHLKKNNKKNPVLSLWKVFTDKHASWVYTVC